MVFLVVVSQLPACVGARERRMAVDTMMHEKMEQQRWESSAFFIRVTCADEADKVIDGRFVLEPPYSYKVYPGKSYRLTLQFPDGRCYDGYVETISDGGSYGRYPGYELCFESVILREMDTRGSMSYYIQSPTGQKVLRVTLSRR